MQFKSQENIRKFFIYLSGFKIEFIFTITDTILFTGLVAFMHTDVMLSILFRPMLLIKI